MLVTGAIRFSAISWIPPLYTKYAIFGRILVNVSIGPFVNSSTLSSNGLRILVSTLSVDASFAYC